MALPMQRLKSLCSPGCPRSAPPGVELFQEEVRVEAERLENGESSPSTADPTAVGDATAVRDATAVTDTTGVVTQPTARTPQEMVDHLRASVAELNRMLEARS